MESRTNPGSQGDKNSNNNDAKVVGVIPAKKQVRDKIQSSSGKPDETLSNAINSGMRVKT